MKDFAPRTFGGLASSNFVVLGGALLLNLAACAGTSSPPSENSSGGSGGTTTGSGGTSAGASSIGGTSTNGGSGGTAASGTGGVTGSSAGSGGITSSAGTGASGTAGGAAGGSGTAGAAAGGGGTAGAQALVVDCGSLNYTDLLGHDCAMIGCHRPPTLVSGLNLTPDSGLVSRLKDVPAKHGDILCPPDSNVCVPATCDPSALLVNSASPDKSWILAKLRGTQNGCGDQMPSMEYDPAKEQCLEKMVNAIAALPK
jgi:hypothetical protein